MASFVHYSLSPRSCRLASPDGRHLRQDGTQSNASNSSSATGLDRDDRGWSNISLTRNLHGERKENSRQYQGAVLVDKNIMNSLEESSGNGVVSILPWRPKSAAEQAPRLFFNGMVTSRPRSAEWSSILSQNPRRRHYHPGVRENPGPSSGVTHQSRMSPPEDERLKSVHVDKRRTTSSEGCENCRHHAVRASWSYAPGKHFHSGVKARLVLVKLPCTEEQKARNGGALYTVGWSDGCPANDLTAGVSRRRAECAMDAASEDDDGKPGNDTAGGDLDIVSDPSPRPTGIMAAVVQVPHPPASESSCLGTVHCPAAESGKVLRCSEPGASSRKPWSSLGIASSGPRQGRAAAISRMTSARAEKETSSLAPSYGRVDPACRDMPIFPDESSFTLVLSGPRQDARPSPSCFRSVGSQSSAHGPPDSNLGVNGQSSGFRVSSRGWGNLGSQAIDGRKPLEHRNTDRCPRRSLMRERRSPCRPANHGRGVSRGRVSGTERVRHGGRMTNDGKGEGRRDFLRGDEWDAASLTPLTSGIRSSVLDALDFYMPSSSPGTAVVGSW